MLYCTAQSGPRRAYARRMC